ncbi:hypothetical protein Tco_0325619, partial [Tanacetum coccineum]
DTTPLLAWCALEYDVDDCDRPVTGYQNVVHKQDQNKQHIFDEVREHVGFAKLFRLFEKGVATCWLLKEFKAKSTQGSYYLYLVLSDPVPKKKTAISFELSDSSEDVLRKTRQTKMEVATRLSKALYGKSSGVKALG